MVVMVMRIMTMMVVVTMTMMVAPGERKIALPLLFGPKNIRTPLAGRRSPPRGGTLPQRQ